MNTKNILIGSILAFLLFNSGAAKSVEPPKINDVINVTPAQKKNTLNVCKNQKNGLVKPNRNADVAGMAC